MKLHIGVGQTSISGYVNIDPLGGEDKFVCNPRNIDWIAEPNQCTEILADNLLDYIPSSDLFGLLRYYSSKLRHGGVLIVGGTDLYSVSKAVFTGILNIKVANELLYGNQKHPWDFKYGTYTMSDVIALMESLGLVITKKRLNNHKFVVIGERQ